MNPKDVAALERVPLQLLPAITSVIGAMACRQGAIMDYFEKDMKSGRGQAEGTGEQGRTIGGGANAQNTPIRAAEGQG